MSAYILEPAAFAAMAERITQYRQACVISAWRGMGHRMDQTPDIARKLAAENIRSVAARYPDDADGERPGPCMRDAEIMDEAARVAECMLVYPPQLSDLQMLKLIDCYEYQTCETEDWEQTHAIEQVRALRRSIIRHMPGYDEAAWGLPEGVADRYEPARFAAAGRTGREGPICLSALIGMSPLNR